MIKKINIVLFILICLFRIGEANANIRSLTDSHICKEATKRQPSPNSVEQSDYLIWNNLEEKFVSEAKRRGLTCNVVQPKNIENQSKPKFQDFSAKSNEFICLGATTGNPKRWSTKSAVFEYVQEAIFRGLDCEVKQGEVEAALINELKTYKSDKTIHQLQLECEPKGSLKQYKIYFWGFNDKNNFLASKYFGNPDDKILSHTFVGKLNKSKFLINGISQKSESSSKLLFTQNLKSNQGINDALSKGIEGTYEKRKCKLTSKNYYPLNIVNWHSKLIKDKIALEELVLSYEADPLLVLKKAIDTEGKSQEEIEIEIDKLIKEKKLAEAELIKQLKAEKTETADAKIKVQKLLSEIAQIEADKILSLQSTSQAKLEADELLKNLQSQIGNERAVFDAQMEAERLAIEEAEQQALLLAEKRETQTEALKVKLEKTRLERQKAEEAAQILASFTEKEEKQLTGELAQEQNAKNAALTQVASATQPTTVATSSSVSVTNTASEQTVRVSASASKWQNASSPEEAQAFANDIQASIVMFMAIAEVIEKQPPTLKDRVLGIVTSEIKRLQSEKELLQAQLTNRFSTPIRPTNANLSVSAFRAADTFPKIPFYVPGTNEIGEMLVVPRITDDGYLQYQFDFLDPTATYDKVRDSISIEHKNVDLMIGGLQKVDEWTLVAQENGVTRRVEKTSACIPDGACENKVQGVSSTEVVFQIYEDGSTAGRIQRNKGQFSTGYNMSVESSILLSAYLTYMRDVGSKEFNIGIMSDDDVKDLFQ